MKFVQIALFTFMIAASTVVAPAQTGALPIAPTKLAVVDTGAFTDSKTGINRIIEAYGTLEIEFKPKKDEIIALGNRYEQLRKEIAATPRSADPKTIAAKYEQAETLQKEIKRKQEDAQASFNSRQNAVITPLSAAVSAALQAYAKQQKIDIVLDVSKFASGMMVANQAIDITAAFIKEYNARNPAAN